MTSTKKHVTNPMMGPKKTPTPFSLSNGTVVLSTLNIPVKDRVNFGNEINKFAENLSDQKVSLEKIILT